MDTQVAGPLFGHWYAQHDGELVAYPQSAEGGTFHNDPPPHPSDEDTPDGWYAPEDLIGEDRLQVLRELDHDPSREAGEDLTRQQDGEPEIVVTSLTPEQLAAVLQNDASVYPDAGKVPVPDALYELGYRASRGNQQAQDALDSVPGAADAAKAQVEAAQSSVDSPSDPEE